MTEAQGSELLELMSTLVAWCDVGGLLGSALIVGVMILIFLVGYMAAGAVFRDE